MGTLQMAAPHAKMAEEGLQKVRELTWGRAKWRRRAAATATHGVPAESPLDGSHSHMSTKKMSHYATPCTSMHLIVASDDP